MAIDYSDLFVRSWKKLRDNPRLLIPLLFRALSMILLFAIILYQLYLILEMSGIKLEALLSPMSAVDSFNSLFEGRTLNMMIIFGIIDILIVSVFVSFTSSMQWSMTRELLYEGKITNILSHGSRHIWKFLCYYWFMFLIAAVPFIFILYLLWDGLVSQNPLSIIIMVLMLLVFIAYWVFISASLLFVPSEIVVRRDDKRFQNKNYTIPNLVFVNMSYFRSNIGHVMITWVIPVAVSTGIAIVFEPLSSIPKIGILFVFLRTVAVSIVNIWSSVFVMMSYMSEGPSSKSLLSLSPSLPSGSAEDNNQVAYAKLKGQEKAVVKKTAVKKSVGQKSSSAKKEVPK